jgi:hypothetical protein
LPAPVGQLRGVEAFASEQLADFSGFGALIGLLNDPKPVKPRAEAKGLSDEQ